MYKTRLRTQAKSHDSNSRPLQTMVTQTANNSITLLLCLFTHEQNDFPHALQ